MRNVTALVLSCLLALSVMAGTAHAQITGGSLIGGLEDAQGGALPGVVMTIHSPALDGSRLGPSSLGAMSAPLHRHASVGRSSQGPGYA